MVKCQKCNKEVLLPFKCPYCGGYFCSEHRIPENHDCPEAWRARAPTPALAPVVTKQKSPYEYEITFTSEPELYRKTRSHKIWFSMKELQHLTISALLVVAIGFSFMGALGIRGIYLAVLVSIFTLSFLAHEMAHKFAAQSYGLWAEFRIILIGALLTLISVFLPAPFKIISPGAVMIAGFVEKDAYGRIAVAGPSTNILFSAVLLGMAHLPLGHSFRLVLAVSAFINAWMGLFNLIPLGLLDGAKVFLWNKKVWLLTFIASAVFMAYSLSLF